MSQLPMGWTEATLEQLCSFNPRHDSLINRQIEISFVPMPAVSDVEGIILPHETRLLEEVWKGYTHFQDNDVIFAKITPCMENGKIALASDLCNGLACGSTEFHVLRSLGVLLPEYTWRFIRQLDFRKEAEQRMTGAVGQRRVPVQFLKQTTIPLPPLNEQGRIVAKLDRLFARSRCAREELGRVSGLVQRYKQAVLAAAFRGDLTADWREDNPEVSLHQNFIQSIKQEKEHIELFPIPDQWQWVKWEDVLSLENGSFKRGPFGSALTKKIFVPKGYKVYEQYCPINDDCSFSRYYITQEKFKELESFSVRAGDFLISCSVVTLGRITQIPDCYEEGIINQALLRVRINNEIIGDLFFKTLFRSPYFQEQIFSNSSGTAIPNVKGVKELKAIPIPLPPVLEQKEIVRRIERLFKAIDLIEQEHQKASKLLDRLEQATLSKAFRGELVPQDPNDEPAAVLLERIRGDRQAQPKRKAIKSKQKHGAK